MSLLEFGHLMKYFFVEKLVRNLIKYKYYVNRMR